MAGRFKADATLRRGRFCVTARGRRLADNEVVVLKEIVTDEVKSNELLKKAQNEAKTLLKLSAPELVKIHDIVKADLARKKWMFVSEYCQGGSLRQKMSEYQAKGIRFTEKQILEWGFSIATAVNYLHNNHIIHGALNCQNILFEDPSCSVVKVCDYGMAKFREICKLPTESNEDPLAAWCYRAPEAFKGQLDYKSDIWSLGVLLFELAAFDLPYHAFNQTEMVAQMAKPPTKKIPNNFSLSYRDLTGKMLQFRMSNRPCAADVLFDECLEQHVISQFESMKLSLGGDEGEKTCPSNENNENDEFTDGNISGLSENNDEEPTTDNNNNNNIATGCCSIAASEKTADVQFLSKPPSSHQTKLIKRSPTKQQQQTV